jgi:hypothetical protein
MQECPIVAAVGLRIDSSAIGVLHTQSEPGSHQLYVAWYLGSVADG